MIDRFKTEDALSRRVAEAVDTDSYAQDLKDTLYCGRAVADMNRAELQYVVIQCVKANARMHAVHMARTQYIAVPYAQIDNKGVDKHGRTR